MEKLESIFSEISEIKINKKAPKTERSFILNSFLRALNDSRMGKKIKNKKGVEVELKPLSMGFISSKMAISGIKRTEELREFLKDCQSAKNFSAYWWWSTDPKNCNKKSIDTS